MTEDDSELPPLIKLLGGKKNLLIDGVPHAMALKMEAVRLWRDHAIVKIPYDRQLVGDPETGVIHGGVVTTLLDNASGIAVLCALSELASTATLDLRIDYMRAAVPERDIYAHAHCYKVTRSIAFVRGFAYEDDESDPIAASAGAFMLNANNGRKAGTKENPGADKKT